MLYIDWAGIVLDIILSALCDCLIESSPKWAMSDLLGGKLYVGQDCIFIHHCSTLQAKHLIFFLISLCSKELRLRNDKKKIMLLIKAHASNKS